MRMHAFFNQSTKPAGRRPSIDPSITTGRCRYRLRFAFFFHAAWIVVVAAPFSHYIILRRTRHLFFLFYQSLSLTHVIKPSREVSKFSPLFSNTFLHTIIFLRLHSTTQTLTRTHTHTPMNIHTQTVPPYEYLRKLSRQILEIDEVTTNVSLSTGMSPTT